MSDSRPVGRFADYSPRGGADPRPALPADLRIRPVEFRDLSSVALLAAEREGGDVATHRSALEREFARTREGDDLAIWVAELDGRVVAYARTVRFAPPSDAPRDTAPEGWYLMGVVVSPGSRRRGIAEALTRARLDWLAARTDVVRYVANARNAPTIDLHARLGFREVTRRFTLPGVTFDGGVGILFEWIVADRERESDSPVPGNAG